MERKMIRKGVVIEKGNDAIVSDEHDLEIAEYRGTVGVSFSKTVNLGHYENIKLTVSMYSPVEKGGLSDDTYEDLVKSYDRLSKLVKEKFEDELWDIEKEIEANGK